MSIIRFQNCLFAGVIRPEEKAANADGAGKCLKHNSVDFGSLAESATRPLRSVAWGKVHPFSRYIQV
jgi:hypothetical protein